MATHGKSTLTNSSSNQSEDQIFYIRRNGADAKCKLTNEGIVVLAGSLIRKDYVPSCPDRVKALREENKENIDANNVLTKDLLFKTPSGASAFVFGASTNGNVELKTEEGKTLKDIESVGI